MRIRLPARSIGMIPRAQVPVCWTSNGSGDAGENAQDGVSCIPLGRNISWNWRSANLESNGMRRGACPVGLTYLVGIPGTAR